MANGINNNLPDVLTDEEMSKLETSSGSSGLPDVLTDEEITKLDTTPNLNVIPTTKLTQNPTDRLEQTYQDQETAIKQATAQADAQAQAAKAQAEDPTNWSVEQTKQHYKDNPPKNITEAAQAKTAIKIKEDQQKAMADKIMPTISAEPEKKDTFIDKFKSIFMKTPEQQRSEDWHKYAISEATGIPLSTVIKEYRNLREMPEITGFQRDMGTKEMLAAGMTIGAGAGALSAPLATLGGLTIFKAADELENAAISKIKQKPYLFGANKNISDLLPDEASEVTHDLFDIIDLAAKGTIVGGVFKGAPRISEKLTKDVITKYKLPEQVYISPEKVKSIFQAGDKITPEEVDLVKSLGLNGDQYRKAIQSGVSVEVPAEKIVTLKDKPYWAKIKEAFNVKPFEETRTLTAGEPREVPRALLEQKPAEATPTPKEANTIVKDKSGKPLGILPENTPQIDTIINNEGDKTKWWEHTSRDKVANTNNYVPITREELDILENGTFKIDGSMFNSQDIIRKEVRGADTTGMEGFFIKRGKGILQEDTPNNRKAVDVFNNIMGDHRGFLNNIPTIKPGTDPTKFDITNPIVEQGGGKLRYVSDLKNSIYKDDQTVYFDDPTGSTKTLPLSKLTPDLVREKIEGPKPAKIIKNIVNVLPEDIPAVDMMKERISSGEAGQRVKIDGATVEHDIVRGIGSSFPEYFRNKGYTKKETLGIIDKIQKGLPLTEKQTAIFNDLLVGAKEEYSKWSKIYEQEQARESEARLTEGIDKPQIEEAVRLGQESGVLEADERASGNTDFQFGENVKSTQEKQQLIPGTEPTIPDLKLRAPSQKDLFQNQGELFAHKIETDPARVQEIKNSIAEGELILKSGKTISGKIMSTEELDNVRRSIENSKSKIGITQTKTPTEAPNINKEEISAFAQKNKDNILQDYSKQYGNIVSNDNMKRYFASVGYDGTNTEPYQSEAGKLTKEYFNKIVDENKGTGKYVVFTTGGTGSGKSSAVAGMEKSDNIAAVWDINLTDLKKNSQLIGEVLNKGLKAKISYVLRDPEQAFINGVVTRAVNKNSPDYGRVVNIAEHMLIHEKVKETFPKLLSRLGKKVKFEIIDNRGTLDGEKSMTLDEFKNVKYNYNEIQKEIENYVKTKEDLPENLRRAFLTGSGTEGTPSLSGNKRSAIQKGRGPSVNETRSQKVNSSNSGTPGSYIPEKDNLPKSVKSQNKAIAKIDIVKMLEKKLGTPIRKGHFTQRAYGIFKGGYAYGDKQTSPDVIRMKAENWVGTAAHEVGHDLDKRFDITKSLKQNGRYVEPYRSELTAIASRPAVPTKGAEIAEGVAQYVKYFVTDPAKVEKDIPNFNKKFLEIMNKEYPEGLDVLLQARKDYKRWLEQDPRAEIAASIERDVKEPPVNMWEAFRTQMIDDLAPIDDFTTLARSLGIKVPTQSDAYLMARLLKGWEGVAVNFLEKGTIDYKSGDLNGKGLREIIKPLEDKGKLQEFEEYLVAKRAVELHERNIETGINKEKAKAAVRLYEKDDPEFVSFANELYGYNDRLLTYLYDAGVVSLENLAKMKALNKYHVPFYRVLEEGQNQATGTGAKMTNLASPIKKIKGSAKKIIPPLESILKNTYAFVNVAERNAVGQAMSQLAAQNSILGQSFEYLPVPMSKVASVQYEEMLKKALGVQTVEGMNMGPGAEILALVEQIMGELGTSAEDMYNIFRPSMFVPGENIVTVLEQGKKRFYQTEPELYRALMALNKEHIHTLFKVLSIPASWLHAGATLTPEFIARNPIRDQWSAFVFSKYGYVPGWDMIKGLFHAVNKTDLYYEWQRSKGINATLVAMDRKALKKSVQNLVHKDIIFNPIELLRILSSFGEQGTRIGGYIRAKKTLAKQGITGKESQMLAGYESRELTLDFNRAGATGRAINMIIAFWNANVQDYSKIHRTFKDPKTRGPAFTKAILGLTIPSVILWMVNHDDKRYKEIPRWQKMAFWIIMTQNHIYRIPKPFALGSLFGTSVESALDFISKTDPKAIESFVSNFIKQNTPRFIPTAGIPILENWANKSTFYDRPIVSQGKQKLLPEYQYNDWTSETMKRTGSILHFSPAMGENLIRGYFARLGLQGLQITDIIGAKTGILPAKNEAVKTSDVPLINAFAVREPIGASSQSVIDFYDLKDKWEKVSSTVNNLIGEGKSNEAKTFLRESGFTKTKIELIKAGTKAMKELREYRERIIDSNIGQEKKTNLLNLIDKNMSRIARKVLG